MDWNLKLDAYRQVRVFVNKINGKNPLLRVCLHAIGNIVARLGSEHIQAKCTMLWVISVQGRLAEIEGDFECTKVALKQKEKDVEEYRKVSC